MPHVTAPDHAAHHRVPATVHELVSVEAMGSGEGLVAPGTVGDAEPVEVELRAASRVPDVRTTRHHEITPNSELASSSYSHVQTLPGMSA